MGVGVGVGVGVGLCVYVCMCDQIEIERVSRRVRGAPLTGANSFIKIGKKRRIHYLITSRSLPR